MLRNGETGDWIGTFQGHKGAVWACVLNDPALLTATASADFTCRIWNAISGDELHQFQHKHIVRTVNFAHGPDATQFVTGGPEKILRIFDLQRPEAPPTNFTSGVQDSIRCATWSDSTNNTLLISYLSKKSMDVWDVRSGTIVKNIETSGPVSSIEINPANNSCSASGMLVIADGSGVEFRDAATFDLKKKHNITNFEVEAASLCEYKNRFVAGGTGMWVHVYDYATGEEMDCCKGHHGPVHCVQFAPGGATFASGSEDGTIRIWRTNTAAAPTTNNERSG